MRKFIKTRIQLVREKRTFVFPVSRGQTGQMIIDADWNGDSIVQIHKWAFLLRSSVTTPINVQVGYADLWEELGLPWIQKAKDTGNLVRVS